VRVVWNRFGRTFRNIATNHGEIQEQLDEIQIGASPTSASTVQGRNVVETALRPSIDVSGCGLREILALDVYSAILLQYES
jgi:hypothetical protein